LDKARTVIISGGIGEAIIKAYALLLAVAIASLIGTIIGGSAVVSAKSGSSPRIACWLGIVAISIGITTFSWLSYSIGSLRPGAAILAMVLAPIALGSIAICVSVSRRAERDADA